MSRVKHLISGGKYAGKKMSDLLKKIKRKKSSAKSKKNIEKIGLGTKSLKRYNIRGGASGESDRSAIVPVKKQTGRGSSFRTRILGPKGQTPYQGKRLGGVDNMESWRRDMEKITNMPSFGELTRSLFKKKKFRRGGDVMPKRNKKNFRPTEKGAGMTRAGVAAYRRANPGSKLKTAVTGKVKPGSKAAKRRKSFCARSAGQMKKFPKAAADPNSRLRQARRRWKC